MKHLIKFVLSLTLLFTVVSAQAPGSVQILGVAVNGNDMTSASVIKYTSGLVEGRKVNPGEFGKSVQKLWQTGLFSNVQIKLDRETAEGIFLTIDVEENPILGNVEVQGGKRKKKEIEEAANLTKGQRLQPYLLKEATEKIKKLYAEDGYLRTEVDVEVEDGKGTNVKNITFRIREHKKVKTRQIHFTGNQAYPDRKLRRLLKNTKVQKWYLFWRSHFEEDKFEEDKIALAAFYRNSGYRDFRIVSESVDYADDNRGMILNFDIYEGPKYYLRNLSWEGNLLYKQERLRGVLDLEKGDLYDEEEFNKAVYERMHGLYMDRGYIYSRIDPEITPVGKDSLDVHFVVTENQQVSVRKIDISGNTKTRENVVRRELKIMPGDIFSRELLMRSAREVMILNYFSDVRPDVIPVDEDEIDLLVTVEERSSDEANASLGFTEEYGIMGGAGVKFTNFLGKGQQLGLSFQQGTQYSFYTSGRTSRYRSMSFNFTDPMVNDTPVLIGFTAFFYLRGQNYGYTFPLDREVVGSSFRVGRRLKWPDNYFRASWMIQGSRTSYKAEKEEDLQRYVGSFRETVGLAVTQFVTRDSRNHPEFPSQGSVFSWTSTLSGGPLDTRFLRIHENYHKHIVKFDWYAPMFWKFALLNSLQLGAMKKLPSKNGSIIPIDERFLMGGTGIPYGTLLRGYVDNTVGPYIGRPEGGNVLLKAMLELRFPFSENPTVYGLVFAEMGNVWRDFSETDPFDLKRSAGFGVRMFMPMLGMLGFDLGYGFDDVPATPKSPEGWRFHILFGMPF